MLQSLREFLERETYKAREKICLEVVNAYATRKFDGVNRADKRLIVWKDVCRFLKFVAVSLFRAGYGHRLRRTLYLDYVNKMLESSFLETEAEKKKAYFYAFDVWYHHRLPKTLKEFMEEYLDEFPRNYDVVIINNDVYMSGEELYETVLKLTERKRIITFPENFHIHSQGGPPYGC